MNFLRQHSENLYEEGHRADVIVVPERGWRHGQVNQEVRGEEKSLVLRSGVVPVNVVNCPAGGSTNLTECLSQSVYSQFKCQSAIFVVPVYSKHILREKRFGCVNSYFSMSV